MTEFGAGSGDCWKIGHFRDEDIKSGYDARRAITDEIIGSIEIKGNAGIMLYGRPYYGKSIILKRIMFELIDKGYVIVFDEGIRATIPQLLIQLLNRITEKFPKVVVIADDAHDRGSEAIFEVLNYFAAKEKSEKIVKFLFGAREEEFKIAREALERKKAAEVDIALRKTHQIRIGFNLEDAVLFLKKANIVSMSRELSEHEVKVMSDFAEVGYKATIGDPFLFTLGVMSLVSGKDMSTPPEFLSRDLNEKIAILEKDEKLFKTALLCSFMGMFGIPLITSVLESNCVYRYHLKSLAQKRFLLQNGEYKTRQDMKIGY